jgi:serine/threonine protein kinase
MREIFSNNYLKIIENNNNSIFQLVFDYSNEALINSLIKTGIIQGGTSTNNYKIVRFKAYSVKSLSQFQDDQEGTSGRKNLSINCVGQMIASLTLQLNYLISVERQTILGYSPENIIVINDKKFAYLGSEFFSNIENNLTQVSFPFTVNEFYVSPELLKIKEIPSYVHFKTAYFSLACLVFYALLSTSDFYNEYLEHKCPEKILDFLNTHPIFQSKIYWFLSRSLIEEPKKRSLIFI